MNTFKLKILLFLFSFTFFSCHEEEPIDMIPNHWENIIPGEYEGNLEIFYVDCPLQMENIKIIVNRINNYYILTLGSRAKLRVASITLYIISIENFVDENGAIYVDIAENQFYKTQEVGAFRNVIYINQHVSDAVSGSNVEIRLSLKTLREDNIKNIFIRVKKYL